MQTAISVIAWSPEEDDHALHIVHEAGIRNVEVVPNRVWLTTNNGAFQKRDTFLKLLQVEQLNPIAMQSLLYNRPDLSIFGTTDQLKKTKLYFRNLVDAASSVGIKKLVFGSPKNKLKLQRTKAEADREAVLFFEDIGKCAAAKGVTFCIEPTPSIYGGDYLSSTTEVISLLEQIQTPGIALNLDLGTMLINGERIGDIVEKASSYIGHVHISMPNLARVTVDLELHKKVSSSLRAQGYKDHVSIEMKSFGNDNTVDLLDILKMVREYYE